MAKEKHLVGQFTQGLQKFILVFLSYRTKDSQVGTVWGGILTLEVHRDLMSDEQSIGQILLCVEEHIVAV